MTAPSPAAAGWTDEDEERVARAICNGDAEDHGTYTWAESSDDLRDDYRRAARHALAEMRLTAEAACGHLSPALYVGEGQPLAPLMCELPYGHGGAHEARNGDLPPTRWAAVRPSPDSEAVKRVEALIAVAPVMWHGDYPVKAVPVSDLLSALAAPVSHDAAEEAADDDVREQYAEDQNLCPKCLTQQPCPAHYPDGGERR